MDLKSSFGTHVNASKLPPNVPRTLREGDVIGLGTGAAELVYVRPPRPSPSASLIR